MTKLLNGIKIFKSGFGPISILFSYFFKLYVAIISELKQSILEY